MFGLTDVPDWCVYEGKGKLNPYDHKLTGTVELLTQLYDKSPIKHIDNVNDFMTFFNFLDLRKILCLIFFLSLQKVKTPVMFLIGLADLRVPPSQGIQYHKALLARNVPTKLVTYKDDNHPLDKPQTTADGVIHSVLWFEKYTK
jgi:acylaminoacyl-peptidase